MANTKDTTVIPTRKVRDLSRHPLVTIIVPTFNSSKTLEQCLKSIEDQDYSPVDVIIVDKYSTDSTRQIAANHRATYLRKGPERSSQKNWGAKFARGELLYFVDSDFILEQNTVSKCVEVSRHCDAVTTVNYSRGQSLWGKSIALKERFLAHDPTIQTVRFIRKNVFLNVSGFDQNLIVGEDLDLYRRLQEEGFNIRETNAIEWHTGEPETLRDVAKRSYYYGKVVDAYFQKRKAIAVQQLSPFKIGLLLKLIKTGSPYLPSLGIVDITRWISTLFGLILASSD